MSMLKSEYHYTDTSRLQQKTPSRYFPHEDCTLTPTHCKQRKGTWQGTSPQAAGEEDPKQEYPQKTIIGGHVQ